MALMQIELLPERLGVIFNRENADIGIWHIFKHQKISRC
jgi:hypothetical protein